MPHVIVQHPEAGEWVRFFLTMEEAERYKKHITEDRGMLAQITCDLTHKDRLKQVARGRWHDT